MHRYLLAMLLLPSALLGFSGPLPDTFEANLRGDTHYGPRRLSVDASTRALEIIDYDHHEIHEGDAYTISSSSATLATNDTFTVLLRTGPASSLVHMVNQLESTGEGQITFLEAPTVSASGTGVVIYNRRRDSTNTAVTSAFVNPTLSGGTVLRQFVTGIGKTTPGATRSTSEWILKPSTYYAVRFTARANGIFCELKTDWYEHADKN